MHIAEMKKRKFIKNKVVERIMKTSVEKATLIPHNNVTHGIDIWMKLAMHGRYETNSIWIWHIRSHFLSPCMLVAHVNGCWVEIYVNIKLPFFLHVLISLKKISFNIVGHGMDLIVEVLLPCLRTLTTCTFTTLNLMMKRLMKITLKNHGLLICVSLRDQMIPPPMWKKRKITTNLQVHPPP